MQIYANADVRLISVEDVVITPMNPYQPIPFHILSSSRILIYAGSNISDKKYFERNDRFSQKTSVNIDNTHTHTHTQ